MPSDEVDEPMQVVARVWSTPQDSGLVVTAEDHEVWCAMVQSQRRLFAEHKPTNHDEMFEMLTSRDPCDCRVGLGDLYDVARRVTDEVFGAGTYADMNARHPDPGVQAAILRYRAETEDS